MRGAVLFLNWLRYQLKFSWQEIVAAGASTLSQVYTNLTGHTDGFAQFSALMQAHFPAGSPSGALQGENLSWNRLNPKATVEHVPLRPSPTFLRGILIPIFREEGSSYTPLPFFLWERAGERVTAGHFQQLARVRALT